MRKRTIKHPPLTNVEHPPDSKPSYSITADIADFMLDRRVRRVTDKTLRWHEGALPKFNEYCASIGVHRLSDINARVLRAYLVNLAERGHNDGGISNLYRSVRAFLHWAEEEFEMPSLGRALKKVPCPNPSTEPLEPIPLAHVSAMVAQCIPRTFTGERDRAILLMLLDTGIRHQELTDLAVEDVKTEDGSVHIIEGKGGKSRTVFIGMRGRQALRSYLRIRDSPIINALRLRHTSEPPSALWLTDEGTPLTKSGIRQIIARRAKQAGVPEPGLHEFRRAFCLNSLRNGMDVITLQRLMGHSTLAIINRYLKLLSDDLRIAHEKFGVVDNL